jgi:hypothetical protein
MCGHMPLVIIVLRFEHMSPYIEIMITFSKPFNVVMLTIGAYVLQTALMGTTVFSEPMK